ncbi:CvpA family protein [Parablautia intestinalis]|uniref:CvpA family protein n=1 Tax=Parablautia intestinalis TaxID=2320100 RepID=A0A3A9AFF5_9FIRM|nr:CvpA family protein [Parablautia intestinalis]RKI90008.1 CvpA family protein [Parablautia intestinalis]
MKKKIIGKIIICLAGLLALFVYYYVTIPAINIHSTGTWGALFLLVLLLLSFCIFRQFKKDRQTVVEGENIFRFNLKESSLAVKALAGLLILLGLVYLTGALLSSPFFNAAKYQRLLSIGEREFTDDIKQVDYKTIPLLDKESASLLGNRKMGSMVDMVSQFEVSGDYAQINYQGKPVRVTPLTYASPIKWLTNQKNGIPAYILIDMTTQNTECVKLSEGIRYSKGEYFNRNIYRHLRFRYPTYIFDEQIFFEIDEEGTPYWVCPVKKFNIGLFGGQTIGRVVLCNAQTGECVDYAVTDVPAWIDKVYSADLLIQLYDYSGILKHGFWNSVLGQKDCLQSTNGYNYIALEDDVWVYTGITSVSGDQSNVGFVLMNQRTMETRSYKVEGAIEDSAMSSAEGQVQNLGYCATFPLLLNIADEPTYFMALKDGAGLVKKYAMVNVQKYQWVAIGDTVQECEKNYTELLNTNGIVSNSLDMGKSVTGKIENISPVVLEGNTHYYICLENKEDIYDIDMSDADLIQIIRYQAGDTITIEYLEGYGLHEVRGIK